VSVHNNSTVLGLVALEVESAEQQVKMSSLGLWKVKTKSGHAVGLWGKSKTENWKRKSHKSNGIWRTEKVNCMRFHFRPTMRMRNAANILMSVCITNAVFHIRSTKETPSMATQEKPQHHPYPQIESGWISNPTETE